MPYPVSTEKISEFKSVAELTGSYLRSDRFSKMIEADAVAYATRFNHIFSELRDEGNEGTALCNRPFQTYNSSGSKRATMRVASLVFMVPNPIPGTTNLTVSGGGTTTSRGFLKCYSRAKNAKVRFELRNISLDGVGGMTVNGSSSSVENVHVFGGYAWQDNELLYPSGTASGDIVELRILWERESTSTTAQGYLSGLAVYEPSLFTIDP